jgi:hypothetical protein
MEPNAPSVVENWRSLPIAVWDNGANFIDWRLVVTITVPAVVVVLGWFLGHWLNTRRDLKSRKREARLQALEAAYMRLATSSNRSSLTDTQMDDLELFFVELPLFGTPQQIELMKKIASGHEIPGNKIPYDPMLQDLRDTIRKELHLEDVGGPVKVFRFKRSG